MNVVARRSRPKPAGASRERGRRRRTDSPSRAHGAMTKERHVCARRRAGEAAGRPNENSPAGRENRTTEQAFMNSPG
ncbi:conserved hypothetical protein [Nitrospira sp. ND1]|nr:conserved hypothetical protein [Nitrospira sp. ND1]